MPQYMLAAHKLAIVCAHNLKMFPGYEHKQQIRLHIGLIEVILKMGPKTSSTQIFSQVSSTAILADTSLQRDVLQRWVFTRVESSQNGNQKYLAVKLQLFAQKIKADQ